MIAAAALAAIWITSAIFVGWAFWRAPSWYENENGWFDETGDE